MPSNARPAETDTPLKTASPSCSWTVRKNQSLKSLHIGIDARLAYRRGVGTYTANLVKALSRLDRRNRYTIFNAPEILRRESNSPRFDWVQVPYSNAAYYEQVLLPRAARNKGMDFLHYTDNSGTVLGRIPFLLTLHDAMYIRPLSQVRPRAGFRERLVDAYKKWAIPRSALSAGAVLTVSEYSKARILAHTGLASQKVFVVPEGVDRGSFRPKPRKPSGTFRILVQAAADERKNLSNILKAVEQLSAQVPGFRLTAVGMDREELKRSPHLREALPLEKKGFLEWAGNLSLENLKRAYAKADLFLYPSRLEGFGLPILEAFACGLPVVASNTTSIPEVAGNAALLVDPEDPRAIAGAVKRMMGDGELRRSFIRRGLRRVRDFTWEKTARGTLSVYESWGRTRE
jgi:glycosyltransferase involved in cell wall biosynthesis